MFITPIETMFDPQIALEEWSVTGQLSGGQLEALERSHRQGLEVHQQEAVISVNIAPGDLCEAAAVPHGSAWPVVIAAVLDHEAPRGPRYGSPVRCIEALDALVRTGLMEQAAADHTLEVLAG